jgi:hypothetical protein
MYCCHLCTLKTKQLNGLMTKHYQKHCSNIYSKEQYKVDVLNISGRPQKACKVCSRPTLIPKGEDAYPEYCRPCYDNLLSQKVGANNINWKGGKKVVQCAMCLTVLARHASHLRRFHKFCSTSCAQSWYGLSENRTEAQKENDKCNAKMMKKLWRSPRHRERMAKMRSLLGTTRTSKKEQAMVALLQTIYSDCVGAYTVKYYTFDAFIPSLNILIEFDGTYWHSLPKCAALDKRKTTYIDRWHPYLAIVRIKEGEWDASKDKIHLMKSKLQQASSAA